MKNTEFEFALKKAKHIKMLITDCDGVLTDGGVYYDQHGEAMKKFNVRDGMGVERLRKIAGIPTVIISGEKSPSLKMRAAKLQIEDVHLGIKNKLAVFKQLCVKYDLDPGEIAYIGDDCNDMDVMMSVGLSAAPADAIDIVKSISNYLCKKKGGKGAFREFADLIIISQTKTNNKKNNYDYSQHA